MHALPTQWTRNFINAWSKNEFTALQGPIHDFKFKNLKLDNDKNKIFKLKKYTYLNFVSSNRTK